MYLNHLNPLQGIGNEAFEDVPVVTPENEANPIAVAAAAAAVVELNELQSQRDLAVGRATLAQLDNEAASQERAVEATISAVDHIETVQAGLEAFVAQGSISPRTAALLQQQINGVMIGLGKDGVAITNGGLESFGDNPDAVMVALGAGLEALDKEKKSMGARLWQMITTVLQTIGKFLGEVFSQNKRVRARAEEISASIKGKPAKQLKLSSQYLLMGKEYTGNINGDLKKFKDGLVNGAVAAIKERGAWYFKTASTVIEDINTSPTLDNALTVAKKLVPPAVKGASVSVKDEDGLSLKRTEVYLGNYAIFELVNKAPAPTNADSAVVFITAMSKCRLSIQQAKIQAPEPKEFTVSEGNAQQIITCVKDILAAVDDLKPVVDQMVSELKTAQAAVKGEAAEGQEAEVKRISSAAVKIPGGLADTISQLPRSVSKAALNVSEAALDLVVQLAKGEKASKEDKGAKPQKADKPEKDEKADKGEEGKEE